MAKVPANHILRLAGVESRYPWYRPRWQSHFGFLYTLNHWSVGYSETVAHRSFFETSQFSQDFEACPAQPKICHS